MRPSGANAFASLPATIAISVFLGADGISSACNVPVFRYALERWAPDELEATLLHHGPLSSSDGPAVSAIRDAAERYGANLGLSSLAEDARVAVTSRSGIPA
jgi:hypothetical protein